MGGRLLGHIVEVDVQDELRSVSVVAEDAVRTRVRLERDELHTHVAVEGRMVRERGELAVRDEG